MHKVIYFGKEFPSKRKCTEYLEINYVNTIYLEKYYNISFTDAVTIRLAEKISGKDFNTIYLKALYKDKDLLNKIEIFVKSLNKPITQKRKENLKLSFIFEGKTYMSALDYCVKNHIPYTQFMKYKSRHKCSIIETIKGLREIKHNKDICHIRRNFVDKQTYDELENDYGEKVIKIMHAILKEGLQEKIRTINFSTFVKAASLLNINLNRKEMEELITYINERQSYIYKNISAPSLKKLCSKLSISYPSLLRVIRECNMNYKDAIKYTIEHTRKYEYNGKIYKGFNYLCNDYNISLNKIRKISLRENISKMDAFKKLVGDNNV